MRISFASDNTSGVHPKVLRALEVASRISSAPAYGADELTDEIQKLVSKRFGPGTEAFFVFNGSAANVLSLAPFLKPFEAVITADSSHLENDECGAFERIVGSKILTVPAVHGKLTPELIEPMLAGRGDIHHAQPRAISITQTTECGTLYTLSEMKALADYAHAHDLILHVDGARFSNAVAALGVSLADMAKTGMDVLSFGGTKNGLMLAEAVVFFNRPKEAKSYLYHRKQSLQLASKMRFMAAQFAAYMEEDLFLQNARHANAMGQRLAQGLKAVPGIEIMHPVEANVAFVKIPQKMREALEKDFYFYMWDEAASVARWMCSFETTSEQVDALVSAVRRLSA